MLFGLAIAPAAYNDTGPCAVIGCKLKQNANEGCNSCAKSCRTCFKFYCMFYFTCDRSLSIICAAKTHCRGASVEVGRPAKTRCRNSQDVKARMLTPALPRHHDQIVDAHDLSVHRRQRRRGRRSPDPLPPQYLTCGVINVLDSQITPTQKRSHAYDALFMSPLRRHIFVCCMAKSAFWRGFSALAPDTGVGPI